VTKKPFIFVFVLLLLACEDSPTAQVESPKTASSQQVVADPEPLVSEDNPVPSEVERMEKSLSDIEARMGIKLFADPWTGDLDVLSERRVIRVLTVYGPVRYFLDGAREVGVTYEFFKLFENFVNTKMGKNHLRIHVVFIPVARDQLISGLINGRGDIAAAGLTITPERDELIDFSNPASKTLSEVLVTGPAAPQIETIDDLAGHRIYVRASSSYRSSLDALNLKFEQRGLEKIDIEDADELLEDEDILEMVNAGLLEWAVVDDYKANVWADVFKNLTVRDDIVLRSGGRIGFAIRENSPQLAEMLNEFLRTHKQGTLKGNVLINRYLKEYDWAKNALAVDDYQRFQDVVDIFLKYGEQYGVDYLMVTAQGYQESRLDQTARSGAGAIGIMQLLPSTAADPNVRIPDIEDTENNIHAGIKYLNFVRNRYFSDPGMTTFNKTLFSFAAYNAGPARVRQLRKMAEQQGYDPNVWFDNVEVMAAKVIGRETVQYVANILKYYVAYNFAMQQQLERKQARDSSGIK
jgi:membrane-bound lytic murein transglycosylase MltF